MEKKIKEILACRGKACISDERLTKAAVLIPLFKKNNEYHILFTRRTEKVRHHKGQISFPGGRQDPDEDLLTTALREASEEMGIDRKDVKILGELDDFCTLATDFCVTPFVGLIPYPYPFRVNRREIEEVLEVPLLALLDETGFREELHERNGEPFPVYFYRHNEHTIWGATARILKQLLELIPKEEDKQASGVRTQNSGG